MLFPHVIGVDGSEKQTPSKRTIDSDNNSGPSKRAAMEQDNSPCDAVEGQKESTFDNETMEVDDESIMHTKSSVQNDDTRAPARPSRAKRPPVAADGLELTVTNATKSSRGATQVR
jgi:hypothetical protein